MHHVESGSNYKTISAYGGEVRQSVTKSKTKMSEGYPDGSSRPPKVGKKIRPFSAPRRQGLRSVGLKNKVTGTNSQSIQPVEVATGARPMTGVHQTVNVQDPDGGIAEPIIEGEAPEGQEVVEM